MLRDLPHLASRLFGVPLLVDERKLDVVMPAIIRRLEGGADDPDPDDARAPADPYITGGIAVIPAIGSLVRRKTIIQAYSGLTSYADILKSLRCCLDDGRVRGILLQVDSFGGEAPGCFELCDEIFKARSVKPIWGIADVTSLSAGYAILSQCERALVAPSGMVGSIGCTAVHLSREKQNEQLGLTYTVFRAGEFKDEGNSLEPLSKHFGEKLQASINNYRQKFAEVVARGRSPISVKNALDTEGDWFDAPDGLKLKLVDGLATYEDAFAQFAADVAAPARVTAPAEPVAPPEDDPPSDATSKAGRGKRRYEMEPDTIATATETKPTAPVVPPTPVAAAPIVDLDSVRSEATRVAQATSREIAELCTIAGKPELAAKFITEGLSVADVRKQLVDERATAAAATPAVDNHQPPRKATAAQTADVWNTAYAKVHASMDARRRA